ncbi:MAG TPA: hypothetical protein DF613_01505 [Lachnospiraceae bacterium]|nr:hypothetical protein [Lachnospiraceae bacterium]
MKVYIIRIRTGKKLMSGNICAIIIYRIYMRMVWQILFWAKAPVAERQIITMKKRVFVKEKVLSFVLALAMCVSLGTTGINAATASYAVTVATDKYYTIKNVGSGNKYLNVYANSSANNANITLWEADGTGGEEFQFVKSGSSYVIVPRCAKKRALNVYTAGSAKDGNNVCTWTKTGDSTQRWVVTYEDSKNAYVIRSANNNDLCLTAAGSKNGANVSVQKYTGRGYQLWACSAFSAERTDPSPSDNEEQEPSPSDNEEQEPSPSNNGISSKNKVKAVQAQIRNAYAKARKMSGMSSFNGWCGTYVRYQLAALGIINQKKDRDCNGNGNKFFGNVKTGKTSTGYKKVKLKGYRLADVVKKYGKNVSNILISYTHQYGATNKKPGAGHVVFIHAVINGKVYYSESYSETYKDKKGKNQKIKEGSVRVKTVKDFDIQYTRMYGKAKGAVCFYR